MIPGCGNDVGESPLIPSTAVYPGIIFCPSMIEDVSASYVEQRERHTEYCGVTLDDGLVINTCGQQEYEMTASSYHTGAGSKVIYPGSLFG